ncbi:MAG TPA: hypothetical protein ENH10_03735 [Bacteroidetes bacterium]|nr:transposase for transposon Tn5 [bacterium BMS3Bbin04]HDO65128.1 hypothetical protein [Bacteroidota bacterium]HEX04253.1 hypothetical protein [Bacteroidota bacterium]
MAFVGVYLLQLRDAANDTPEQSCEDLLTGEEWRLLWLSSSKKRRLPSTPPTLQWAYQALGRLGGWTDSKRTGRVGWQALCNQYRDRAPINLRCFCVTCKYSYCALPFLYLSHKSLNIIGGLSLVTEL